MRWLPYVLILIGAGCSSRDTAPKQAPVSLDNVPAQRTAEHWRLLADSLSLEKQQTILQKVLSIAEREGWAGAVRYCQAAAETLTRYQTAQIILRRVALRYRNPQNKLADSLDHLAYEHYAKTQSQESLLWELPSGELRYYRPIYIQMPQCLKCHGKPEDLDGPALAQIRKYYPGDKARDFSIGDLRGLWKGTIRP
ncbi:MAG: cytochrome c [Bacteroidia bacterium]|nr:MAG: cytochrome c [Bacteroidia bacterium]